MTVDVDWALDAAIDFVADALIERQVSATWFITHRSPAVDRLRAHASLFELGVHPNFLHGSTHGSNPAQVLQHCFEMVPEAASVRTHALVQSTPLLAQIMATTRIATDVSLFLPRTPSLGPVSYCRKNRTLLRIPYCWEDDFEMEAIDPWWHLRPLLELGDGLKVLDFHPIHVLLNSSSMGPYEKLKRRAEGLTNLSTSDLTPYINDGEGTRTMFFEALDALANAGESVCIRDVAARWAEGQASRPAVREPA